MQNYLKFYSLIGFLLMIFGSIFCLSAINWLWAWVGLELNLIGFVSLFFLNKKVSSSEAAMKYIIIQSVGSSLILFSSLFNLIHSSLWVISSYAFDGLMSCLLLGALGVKLGLFPFYYWLPSVAKNCSMGICMILLSWQKIAPLGLIFIVYNLNLKSGWSVVLVMNLMCVISSLIGGLGGMNSTHFRNIMAYSSINHSGWIVFGGMMNFSISWVYMFIYVFTVIVIFFPFILISFGNVKNLSVNNIGFYSYMFILLQLLSLGGLPPLLGFYGKLLIIMCGFSCFNSWIWILILILGSLFSLYYYLFLVFVFFINMIDLKNFVLFKNWSFNSLSFFVYMLVILITFCPIIFVI
uniref:NADH-ubiquinone oxidoreductase chain 2 n=1 Tax=Pleuropoma jana TaxID=1882665 RepID=A0A1B2G3B1_9GAST|nr:NADH dehydrogenase subunit 2 [Pleuropoma jana]